MNSLYRMIYEIAQSQLDEKTKTSAIDGIKREYDKTPILWDSGMGYLSGLFVWSNTPEGFEFWDMIQEKTGI